MSEFVSFIDIKKYTKDRLTITQKLHGTNASVLIYPDENGTLQLKTGSRTRWIVPDSDNYGFASFVYSNKEEFITILGEGRHFGEWIGPGINSGEGLKEKTFVLFNWERWQGKPLPVRTTIVPVLYDGYPDSINETIETVFNNLKVTGSKLVPGYMHPEGIVVQYCGLFKKKVYTPEETQWTKAKGPSAPKADIFTVNVSHLLQPIRLEKLISRDEEYIRDYPKSLSKICGDYIKDLEKEDQLPNDEAIRKALGKQIFPFIKTLVNEFLETRTISR